MWDPVEKKFCKTEPVPNKLVELLLEKSEGKGKGGKITEGGPTRKKETTDGQEPTEGTNTSVEGKDFKYTVGYEIKYHTDFLEHARKKRDKGFIKRSYGYYMFMIRAIKQVEENVKSGVLPATCEEASELECLFNSALMGKIQCEQVLGISERK